MALYFVVLFIFIVSTPFSNVTTSSLYLLSTSTDGLFWGFGDFKSSSVVPNCAEIFKQNSLYICPEQRNKNLIPPTQFYHQIFPICCMMLWWLRELYGELGIVLCFIMSTTGTRSSNIMMHPVSGKKDS